MTREEEKSLVAKMWSAFDAADPNNNGGNAAMTAALRVAWAAFAAQPPAPQGGESK